MFVKFTPLSDQTIHKIHATKSYNNNDNDNNNNINPQKKLPAQCFLPTLHSPPLPPHSIARLSLLTYDWLDCCWQLNKISVTSPLYQWAFGRLARITAKQQRRVSAKRRKRPVSLRQRKQVRLDDIRCSLSITIRPTDRPTVIKLISRI